MVSRSGAWSFFGCLLAALFAGGCGTLYEPSSDAVRLDVPVFTQTPDHCGPASLGAVYRYWGAGEKESDVAARIFNPRQGGTLPGMLVADARSHGFRAALGNAEPEAWRHALTSGVPVICLLPAGSGHFAVLQGWDRDRILVNDGSGAARWRTGGNLADAVLSIYVWPGDYAFDPPAFASHDKK